jgi:dTDP-4-dehydrorhamnose reductase
VTRRIELWAGPECTVNRVGDRYFDQLERTGHAHRLEDLDRIAGLGARAIRMPILWERVAPDGLRRADWRRADERLARARALGLRPIVGLVHHGSGPRGTSLLEDSFVEGLASFARAVAQRYPWVEDYTPVNEPLTTARFSALYGHWYPHLRDDRAFVRALVNECRGTLAAMRAIRDVVPGARLVQTEDLGRTYYTPPLRDQGEFDDERRWLAFDLLLGRVGRDHPLRRWLDAMGFAPEELDRVRDRACPIDLLGVNYYVTSDRVLDHRLELYPAHLHGGNGREAYVDVEAVRVRPEGIAGHAEVLMRAWERYRLPLAITEVHLGCTREEQARWLVEAWRGAHAARDAGADVRAVTLWAVFGSFDWSSLVTRDEGRYEPGAFDVRGPEPRSTALAATARALASGRATIPPVAEDLGWWRRPERLSYGTPPPSASRERRASPLLVVGAGGTLGRALRAACALRGIEHRAFSRAELDATSTEAVRAAIRRLRPWAVVNAAGYVRVDDAEDEPELCLRENVRAPAVLAAACSEHGARLVTFSTDLVFDGNKRAPYLEDDDVGPLGVYARSKVAAERAVLEAAPKALVVRTSAFFGPTDHANFVTRALEALARGERFHAATDMIVSPTYVPDLAHAVLDLLVDGERGLWHLANGGELTWAELARRACKACGANDRALVACTRRELGLRAPRPEYSALGSSRGLLLPDLDDALARYARSRAR